MRYVLIFIATILLATPVASLADRNISTPYSPDVLVGEWASYHSSILKGNTFQYLRIAPDMNGVLVYAYNGRDPKICHFDLSNIDQREGYVEIEIARDADLSMKLIISAFRLLRDQDIGRLTGLIYLYKNQDNAELFNTLFVAMDSLETGGDLTTKKEIRKAREVPLKGAANKSLQPTQ